MAEMAPSDTPGGFTLGFAGDTYNTAWYLAQLAPDIAVSYFTKVGQDAISQNLRDHCRASGIDDTHMASDPAKTIGLYLISLDRGERSFSYWRGQSAAKDLAKDPEALDAAMHDADLIYFSGITLAILDPTDRQALLDALLRARAVGKTIAFDPNLRPRLWASADQMTDAIMQGAAVSDIALPSYEDEASWFKDATPQATALRYIGAGATRVIVKNGADPVHFRDGDTGGIVPVDGVPQVIDTTAAGDSFNAGLLAGLAKGASVSASIVQGCALARIVVQHKGALVPISPDQL